MAKMTPPPPPTPPASQRTCYDLPGFTLPLNFTPNTRTSNGMFPNALDYYADIPRGMAGRPNNTYRDIKMIQVINYITEKPGWDQKVFDEEIIASWLQEFTDSRKDMSPRMIDWVMDELHWKADILQKTDQIVAFDSGVVKSDTRISEELKQALKDVVRPLEDIPQEEKDYHPDSEKRVVDLVHPSLFPVIYGRTRILPGRVIGLDDCLASVGQGDVLEVPPAAQAVCPEYGLGSQKGDVGLEPYSRKFQWLPCDVEAVGDGSKCRIASYINNLHPHEHRGLYKVIGKLLDRIIPLWDTALRCVQMEYTRITSDEEEEANGGLYDRYPAQKMKRPVKQLKPRRFKPPRLPPSRRVNLRQKLRERGLQVIVKLANVELTPTRPDYEGDSWCMEGQLNEHICATAIYYYDSENITDNNISFRQRATDGKETLDEQDGYTLEEMLNSAAMTQNLGSVSTHEGRLLVFPNTMQHRVNPFSLANKSRPGHRKMIALILVDPNLRIISSANVPPQRDDWWEERRWMIDWLLAMKKLPVELRDMVTGYLDEAGITMDEAKQYRLGLIVESKAANIARNDRFENA